MCECTYVYKHVEAQSLISDIFLSGSPLYHSYEAGNWAALHSVYPIKTEATFIQGHCFSTTYFFVALINIKTESDLGEGRKEFILSYSPRWLIDPDHSHSWKEVWEGTQAGAEAGIMEDAAHWLTPWFTPQRAFSYSPGNLPRDGAMGWALPHQPSINLSQTWAPANLIEEIL